MNRAISAVHLVSKHSAEFFWRDTENDFISILCSSLTGKLFTISCFFLVVYRWHNIITAKLSSIQSAICFPVIEALLLICRESSRGEGGGLVSDLRESELLNGGESEQRKEKVSRPLTLPPSYSHPVTLCLRFDWTSFRLPPFLSSSAQLNLSASFSAQTSIPFLSLCPSSHTKLMLQILLLTWYF